MKRLNFNIKDRKLLYGILTIVMICVFTLTIAYAALNAVLTISGNARVTAADWDIYLNNPRVTNGSVTTNVPEIKSSGTLEFETTLNMPGDFYEFTVDVVNGGSLDAMIENVVKNPELTVEQAKYLKYEITYQNGESITTKQLLAKNTTMPIKVRVEYRKDLVASDLPTGQVVLDLSLTLEYVQSDGSGSNVGGNGGGSSSLVSADGDINVPGTIVSIGDQQFYTIGTEGDNVKLLSMFNLYVGNSVDEDWIVTPLANSTGKQDSTAIGYNRDASNETYIFPFIGTTAFSNTSTTYVGSIVEGYVNNYKTILESDYGIDVVEARLITKDELTSEDIGCSADDMTCTTSEHVWIYSTSYWSGSASDANNVWGVNIIGSFFNGRYSSGYDFGVRPVIVISKDYF